MKPNNKALSPAELTRARKLAIEFQSYKLTAKEKKELQEQTADFTQMLDLGCVTGVVDVNPDVIGRTLNGIKRLLNSGFSPEHGCNGHYMRIFMQTAQDIRLAELNDAIKLREVPVPVDPQWPVQHDFILLENWFTTAKRKLARRTPKPVTMAVILQNFNVTRATLLRDKRLTDRRSPDHAENAQHLFDSVEVARFYTRKE